MIGSIWMAAKRLVLVRANVAVGARFHVGLGSIVSATKGLTIGDDVYIGKYCTIQCDGEIGHGTLIANNVGIIGRRDHDYRQVGTVISRAAWIGTDINLQNDPMNEIKIGEDVWIGYGAIIFSGVTIGRGAIISAGSVVKQDVRAYDIVAGNPASATARRFPDDETIAAHERGIGDFSMPV